MDQPLVLELITTKALIICYLMDYYSIALSF
jgi:hypothetical protein